MHWTFRSFVIALLAGLATCQLLSQLPLVVKSPYMQSWMDASNVASSTEGPWPLFWNGHTLGWSSFIQVDGTSYEWTGPVIPSRPNLTATSVTPTRTIFTLKAGPMAFNATYLSPLDPTDLVLQSLPFGYYYVDAWSLDGKPHDVKFYFDITGEILSDDTGSEAQWNTNKIGNGIYHSMRLTSKSTQSMTEINDIARDSTLYFAMENRQGVSWQTGGNSADIRANFNKTGSPLSNIGGADSRVIDDNWPVLSFQVNLGSITQTDKSVVGVIGLIRDPVVQYTTPTGIQGRSSYYWSAYNKVDDILQDVIGNFDDVRTKAISYDEKVMTDGSAIPSKYNDLLSFSLRMALGAMDITIPRLNSGNYNTSDVKIFMKGMDASSGRNLCGFASSFVFQLDTSGAVLQPLLEYQSSPSYKNPYAAPDLGNTYPKVQGNTGDTTSSALESCSSMLIMTLAQALKSGDGTLIYRYYDLLKAWAEYLENITLHPIGYSNADGQNDSDQSNLALKGIIGLYAMGVISNVTGNSTDASHYNSTAQDFYNQWQSLAVSSGHITSIYGDSSNWVLAYNLYAAKLLGSDLVSDQIYTQQSQFYSSQLPTAPKFGFPYSSNSGKAKSHWTMFTAAVTTDSSLLSSMIGMVWNRLSLNDTIPFPSTYIPDNGTYISGDGGRASPAQGAMFAPLALKIENLPISAPPPPSVISERKTNIAAIVGGAVGGLVALSAFGLAAFFWRRAKRRRHESKEQFSMDEVEPLSPYIVQEFSDNSLPIESNANVVTVNPAAYSRKGAVTLGYSAGSQRGTSSMPDTSAGAPSSSSGVPNSDLRTEVEQLRREMSVLRSEHLQAIEPPPLYEFAGADGIDGSSASSDRETPAPSRTGKERS